MLSHTYDSPWMNEELRLFRSTIRKFIETALAPHGTRWRQQHHPDPESWIQAGAIGMLLSDIPTEYGGGGGTFAHEVVVQEELARAGVLFASAIQSIVAQIGRASC